MRHTMMRRLSSPSRFALAAGLLCAPAAVWGQASVLPPNPATQLPSRPAAAVRPGPPAPTPAAAPVTVMAAPIPAAPAMTHGNHAYVTYSDGLLNVRADNSSLNVILREIARQTGMTITGGVADERVFGNYGPADPGVVLATLLDGAGVNMLLHEKRDDRPAELVLTPRTAGPTPPSPASRSFDAEAAAEAQPAARAVPARPAAPQTTIRPPAPPAPANVTPVPKPETSNGVTPVPDPHASPVSSPVTTPPPLNNPNGSSTNTSPTPSVLPTANSVPPGSVATPSTTPPATGIVDAPNPPPAGTTTNPVGSVTSTTTVGPDGSTTTTTTTSPNGVKTPDEIYQQLLKMQQKSSGAAGSSTNPQQ